MISGHRKLTDFWILLAQPTEKGWNTLHTCCQHHILPYRRKETDHDCFFDEIKSLEGLTNKVQDMRLFLLPSKKKVIIAVEQEPRKRLSLATVESS